MVRLRHIEDLSLPRSARSYIDSCATEFYDTDDNTKIAEIAYRLKRGADLLSIFTEDIRQHMEHPAYGAYEDIAKRSIASYIDILRSGNKCSLATSYLADRMKFPALFRLLTEEILFRYWEQPVYDQNIDSEIVECHFDNVRYDYNEIATRFNDAPNAKRKFFKYVSTSKETLRNIDVDESSIRLKNGWALLANKMYGYTLWSDKKEDQRIYPGDASILHAFNEKNKPKYQYRTEVPPMPFSGNLLRAKVIILTLNPGYVEEINKDQCLKLEAGKKEQLLHLMRKALTLNGYGSPSSEKCHPIYDDIAFFQLIGYHSIKFKDSAEIKHLPSTIFTKLLFKYLATKTDKTFLILRSEELWKETIGEDLWGQLDANGRIITKGHKGMSQHITQGNIKKDNGYDKLITILKKYEQKQN